MALTLSIGYKGDFYVEDTRYVVTDFGDDRPTTVVRDEDGAEFLIRHDAGVELEPNVVVSAGFIVASNYARLVFQAPRSIKIDRGETYRSNNDDCADSRAVG